MRKYVWLSEHDPFPPVESADRHGILALGGDLSVSRLIDAYSSGIFPWYEDDQPIIWWSPDPRFVVFPGKVPLTRSMRKILERKEFEIRFDTAFERVIRECARSPRPGQNGTWITEDMINAYCALHREGYAHSVESWKDGELAGGLYGVSIGGLFCGESMFTRVSNASKAAFLTLADNLHRRGFLVIDSQVHTDHVESLGGEHISRKEYLAVVKQSLTLPTIRGNWGSSIFQGTKD
jgi:leucyl/phenylalanyl-tRNA--protein transferase